MARLGAVEILMIVVVVLVAVALWIARYRLRWNLALSHYPIVDQRFPNTFFRVDHLGFLPNTVTFRPMARVSMVIAAMANIRSQQRPRTIKRRSRVKSAKQRRGSVSRIASLTGSAAPKSFLTWRPPYQERGLWLCIPAWPGAHKDATKYTLTIVESRTNGSSCRPFRQSQRMEAGLGLHGQNGKYFRNCGRNCPAVASCLRFTICSGLSLETCRSLHTLWWKVRTLMGLARVPALA